MSQKSVARTKSGSDPDPIGDVGSIHDPFDVIEQALGAADGAADGALAALKDRVAWLTDERDGLLELNAALERENDELNVALLRLAADKQAQFDASSFEAAAPAPAPSEPPSIPAHDAETPPAPVDADVRAEPLPEDSASSAPAHSFGRRGDAEVFECPLADGVAGFALTVSHEGQSVDLSVEFPAETIDPDAEAGERAVIGLSPWADGRDGRGPDFVWSNALRSDVSDTLGRLAAAIDEALSIDAQARSRSGSIWVAAAAYAAAIGRRVRSPSLGGELVGPLCLTGFGDPESPEEPEPGSMAMRWAVAETATFLIFLTRKGRIRLSLAARNIARNQSLTLRIDGEIVFDADIDDGASEIPHHVTADADLGWGPHEIEIIAPSFEREQGGAFRHLHLLIERCSLLWQEHDEEHESEEELFGWTPPLWRVAGAAPPEPERD